tara:strand:- start:278 stop:703 length:426 start_codon:yes stop_codon:yes gene_type:complete
MNISEYPETDEQINLWNSYLNSKKIYPIELIVNKNSKNYHILQKIFKTLKLDRIEPKNFIKTYIDAKTRNDINYFVLTMTNLFLSHKVNKSLSEGQSIKSARTQTVARILCLSFSDPKITEEENFKNLKKIVREKTKNIRT